jgi:hypothetical protein
LEVSQNKIPYLKYEEVNIDGLGKALSTPTRGIPRDYKVDRRVRSRKQYVFTTQCIKVLRCKGGAQWIAKKNVCWNISRHMRGRSWPI